MLQEIDRVAVLGAGSMGHGIAELAAIAGYDVSLRDIEESYVEDGYEQLEWSVEKLAEKGQLEDDPDAVLGRVDTTTNLAGAVADADIVIEAIPEDLELKRNLFSDVADAAGDDAILATNTSSLKVGDIARAVDRPERFCGMHFFNPPVKMDLVEVVSGERTDDGVVDTAYEFVESIDKTPVLVRKDVPEFIVNNVLVPFMEEAAWMFDEGAAGVRQADAAMVFRRGYPMGPFELADFGGLDVLAHSREQWDKPLPNCVETRVENDDLGRKTGEGFYDYDERGVDYEPGDGEGFDTLRIEARMINEAARLVGQGVAEPEDIDIAMRLGGGLPEGTCRTGDKLGLDRVLEKVESLYEETGAARYEPADYLVELVEDGRTGEDAGEGFYDYGDGGPYHYITHTLDDDGVLEVTFDREERLNALSTDMLDEIQRLLETVDTEEVSCVTFEGAGERAFSAGADITGFTTADPTDLMGVDEAVETIYEFERPTIAKVDGLCLGGGFEITLACDIRIATEESKLGSPEINLGLIPGGGGTQRLVRLVGEARTKELVFQGEQISAERAADWGILNRAVPADEFEETVDGFISNISSGPKTALKAAKQVINEGQNASLNTAIAMESQAFGLLATTDDMLEGVEAFTHDRDPNFD
ncbi:3-hydroxyacyl-CoA dehydrogenase NAD-binding domain-containing protein [Halostagnicola sp. A-GB9-2]|uniref:3-hydroxyacyl-CoA dehydrogenase NAD-binding domain-containing protein n=1 Tax=Halostagnicola sp. A-GB9-2 TaxID=3048066 RepID=UPI0024BF4D26|nr:3-hydroxyacyl-CoA dehydrogenase NAD-binding domain-containing protein [Halostagnicola sp. A-GB9-2]MDJ1434406.1 3-hydroxyacyl-CoA dehydrogenase NAD-binding domain-containing protein [Halostagnicola sp. A-GB9-2]